jgi:hypothetical protein
MQFSATIELKCLLISLTAEVSLPEVWAALSATPIRNLLLSRSFKDKSEILICPVLQLVVQQLITIMMVKRWIFMSEWVIS